MSRKLKAGGLQLSNNMDSKHASLMQDYLQLQDEFDALKDRVDAAKTRKATVLAEVRFLRRRLKKLKESPSNLKEKKATSPTLLCASSNTYCKNSASAAVLPESFTQSPKNSSLGTTEIPVFWEPLRTKSLDEPSEQKPLNDNVELVSALKTSDLRNRPNGFIRALPGKRKISWQDQISLQCN